MQGQVSGVGKHIRDEIVRKGENRPGNRIVQTLERMAVSQKDEFQIYMVKLRSG